MIQKAKFIILPNFKNDKMKIFYLYNYCMKN